MTEFLTFLSSLKEPLLIAMGMSSVIMILVIRGLFALLQQKEDYCQILSQSLAEYNVSLSKLVTLIDGLIAGIRKGGG